MALLRNHHATMFVAPDAAATIERPEDGVSVEVHDIDGAYEALRQALLQPPFQPYAVAPHVTIVHPRTSGRGRECWDAATRPRKVHCQFTVDEVTITGFDGARWVVAACFALRGR